MLSANFRYSARSLARTPGLTFVLLLTVALGIGANASVFGFIRGAITRLLPLSGTIVSVFERDADGRLGPISYDRYVSLRTRHESLRSLGAARESQSRIAVGDRSSIVSIAAVTSELADLLNLPVDDGVVISHRVWQSEFDSKAGLRDEQIRIAGADARIAGVAPEWLEGLYVGRAIDVWVAAEDSAVQGFSRGSRTFWAVGRLPASSSLDQVQAAVDSSQEGEESIVVLPYTGMAPDVAGGILLIRRLLPAAAGAVFLVACANVAAFLLFRASARSRERSVRTALGASRRDLARLLICDSILVSLAGGAFAILFAFWTAHIIPVLLVEPDAERLAFAPDVTSILVTSALCAAVTVACGLLPMLEIRRDNPAAVLQRESAGPSRALRRVRAGLVSLQMAFCCVLVISAAQLFAGFRGALRTSAGHRVGEPILVTVQARFAGPDLGLDYFREVERLGLSLPGVSSTAWAAALPGSSPEWYDMRVEPPQLPLREATLDVATFRPPSPAPFRLAPAAGRMFGGADSPEACRVVLVNQEAADELFGGDAVGRRLEDSTGEPVEIIGVVATRRAGVPAPPRPTVYYYGDQIGEQDRSGPTVFRVPRIADTPGAVLTGNIVSPRYFEGVGMSLNAGRMFPEDAGSRGCRLGIINQEAAELYFDGDAVGGAVIDVAGRRTEIVGVVDSSVLRSSQRGAQPALYLPIGQDFQRRMTLILNARTAPAALLQSARDRLGSVPGGDPSAIVVTTLDQHLKRTALASERIATVLVSVCAVLALALGVLGLYGAMSDAARHRRRDIALRLALGARHWRIMRQVVGEGVRLAGAGGAAGMLASLFVTRWLAASMSSTATPTVWVWLAAPSVLLTAVVIAGVLPLRRAAAVNPAGLLQRNEL